MTRDRSASCPQLVTLPAGEFMMGESPEDKFANDTERPAHRVVVARAFAIGKFPVTVGEYRAFRAQPAVEADDELPVVGVSWDDAWQYCHWLHAQTGSAFRLPSEAEWEYACRAGSVRPFSGGGELSPADANFFYGEDGQRIGPGRRTPVGQYPANGFGLHDLHGNVCEWCADVWHPNYVSAPVDGAARDDGLCELRVVRGGAWDHLPRLLRSSCRDALVRTARRDNVGFRLALTLGS